MSKSIVQDQMGRFVEVPEMPQRIVSLVPSQTELLYDLGLGDRVIGVTKFCVHPENWRKEKAIIGGTKQFKLDVISELEPDLIIGNKEENYQEGIEALAEKYPVWMSDILTLEDAFQMMKSVGEITGASERATDIVSEIEFQLKGLKKQELKSAVYLIWRKPYMAAGQQTFIHEMMNLAGFQNVISEDRYPELTLEKLEKLNPEAVLLSSEPYPFKAKHIDEIKKVLPKAHIRLVDGEIFSWYGSRLLKAAGYFKALKKGEIPAISHT